MKMNKLLFVIIGMFFIASAVALEQSLPPQKQYGTVLVWQSCDNSTYSNITSIKNGALTMLASTAMPNIEAGYYSYSFTNTSQLGIYIVNGYCDENGVKKNWAYNFEVTPNGEEMGAGTSTFLIFICLAVVLLLLSFIFKNYIFAFIAGLTFSVTGLYSTIYGFSTYLSVYTQMISVIILGFGLIITVVSAYEFLDEMGGNEFSGGGGYKTEDDEED